MHSIYDAFLAQLQKEGGYLVNAEEKNSCCQRAMWDDEGHRTADTIARPAAAIAEKAGFAAPGRQDVPHRRRKTNIGKQHPFSTREARRRCWRSSSTRGFDEALEMVRQIFEVGGRATPAASTRSTTTTSTGWR